MKSAVDFTEGSIMKKLMLAAFPALVTTFIGMFYNIADTVIVGKFA